jgi:hypothetical protein
MGYSRDAEGRPSKTGRVVGSCSERTRQAFVTDEQVTIVFLQDKLRFRFSAPFPRSDLLQAMQHIYEIDKEQWRLHVEFQERRRRTSMPFNETMVTKSYDLRATLASGRSVPKEAPTTNRQVEASGPASSTASGSGDRQVEASGPPSASTTSPAKSPPVFVFKGTPAQPPAGTLKSRRPQTPPRGSVAQSLPPVWATPYSAKTYASVETQVNIEELTSLTHKIITSAGVEHDAEQEAAHEAATRVLAEEMAGTVLEEEPAPLLEFPPGLTLMQDSIRCMSEDVDWGDAVSQLEDDWKSCRSED